MSIFKLKEKTFSIEDLAALHEQLNEAKARALRAQRLADEAAESCQMREIAYVEAMDRVRFWEKQWSDAK